MSKISSSKKIILEELPSEQRRWFSKVTSTLNPFLDQVYNILTNGIVLGDNVKSQKFSLTIQENQVYPIKVAYTLNERPYAVNLARVMENGGSPGTIPVHSFQWVYVNGTIEITFSGLNSSKAYTANFYTLI